MQAVKRMRFADGIQVSLVPPLTDKAVQGFGELETAVIEKWLRILFRLDQVMVVVECVLENGQPCFQVPIDDAATLAGAETTANVLNETMLLKTGDTEDDRYKVAISIFRGRHNQSSPSTNKFPKGGGKGKGGGSNLSSPGGKGKGKGKGGGSNHLSPAGRGAGKGKGGGRGRGGGGVGEGRGERGEGGGERGRDGGDGEGGDGGGGVGGEKRISPPSKGQGRPGVGRGRGGGGSLLGVGSGATGGGERGRDGGDGEGGDGGGGVGGEKRISPPSKGQGRPGVGRGRGGGGSLPTGGGGGKRTAPHDMGGGSSSVQRTDGGEHCVELVQSEKQDSSIHAAAAMESPPAGKGKDVQVPSSAWAHSTGVCPASPAACPGCPLCTRLCAPMQAANKCMYDTETNQIGSSESPQKCVSSYGVVLLRISSEVRVLLWYTQKHTHKHIHMLEN